MKIKDKARKDINELNILKDIHEQEIKNLKDQLNDKEISLNEYEKKIDKLKNIHIHKQEIKNLKDQLNNKDILISDLKKSNQNPKSRKKAYREPHDHQGKGYVNLPILLSELNIKKSRELKTNIKNLLNHLCDTKQITKKVYNSLIKTITYKNDSQRAN